MYQIIKHDGIIVVEKIIFVKKQKNGVIVACPEEEAMGIVSETDEGFYNLSGKIGLGEYPAVEVRKVELTESIDQKLIILFDAIAEIFEAIEGGE